MVDSYDTDTTDADFAAAVDAANFTYFAELAVVFFLIF